MALFKLRRKVDEPVAVAAPAESIEAMRRRARHRLIGAVVLVLAAIVGFPILFDTQPRPVAVDIPISIPDRNKVSPLPAATQAPVASGKVGEAPVVMEQTPAEQIITEAKQPEAKVAAVEPKPVERPSPQPSPQKGEGEKPKAEPKAEPKADEAAKARALLEGRTVEAAAGRFVVQVGAFAEEAKAKQAQQKLDRAGFRNYRQVAETEDGKRIRVRAGPFASRAEADKAAEKIKGLDLPVRVLTL